jgi:hypothetical protein
VCALTAAAIACSSANPAAPVPPPPAGANAAADGSTLKVSAPGAVAPINDLKLTSEIVMLSARAATPMFQSATPVTLQYRFQVFNSAGTMVENALVSSTNYQVTAALVPNSRHTWKVRAESSGEAGPFSPTASFVTLDPAIINDPLTGGTTTGTRIGGTFIPGQGWQSNGLQDGIQWDIAGGCYDCRLEFDATNFGGQEGLPYEKDLKWVSMGDPNAFNSFSDFRDHPWKMHLVQRADYSTGLEIIWRNGGTDPNGGDPGDHRIKLTSSPISFSSSQVYHFRLDWGPLGYNISINGIDTGLADGWDHWYEVAPLRVQLGCIPRGESFVGIIYRNVVLKKH